MYGGVLLFSSGLTLVTNSLDRAVLTILLAIVLNQTASLEEAVLRKVYPQVDVIIVFLFYFPADNEFCIVIFRSITIMHMVDAKLFLFLFDSARVI